jgi:hypothetical protein
LSNSAPPGFLILSHLSRLKPIVLLTDLREDYAFYWLDHRTVRYMELDPSPDSAKMAWGLFDTILQSERTDTAAGNVVPCEGAEVPLLVKRRRLVFELSTAHDIADLSDLNGLLEPSEQRALALAQFLQSLQAIPSVTAARSIHSSMYV